MSIADIFLNDGKGDAMVFPVVPKKIEIQSPQKIETFESLGQGDLKIISLKGNRKLSLESFFPLNYYPFARDRSYKGMEYVNKIEQWRDTREPLTIALSGLEVIFKCVIENFSYAIQDGSGDIYYNLDIEEYKIPVIKKVTSATKIVTVQLKPGQTQPPKVVDFNKSTYGIVQNKNGSIVRTGKGKNYAKIDTLKFGTKVKLLKLENGWWHIIYNNKNAYISSASIKKV